MEDSYKRVLQVPKSPGRTVNAILTYALDNREVILRDFLLIPFDSKFLNSNNFSAWKELQNLVNSMGGGNFYQDKSIVNLIKEQPQKYPQFKIAIHHFGPVPTLLTGYKYSVDLNGKIVQADVGMYYTRPTNRSVTHGEFYLTKSAFLNAIKDDYDVIMQRYFEDISYELYSIISYNDLKRSLSICKTIEDFIGKSIVTKLKVSTPSIQEWQDYQNNNVSSPETLLCCQVFELNYSQVFIAKYFRLVVLFFINQLYKYIGLEDRSIEYLEKITQAPKELIPYFGDEAVNQISETYPSFQIMKSIVIKVNQNDLDALFDSDYSIWLSHLQKFARFIVLLNQSNANPLKGRIFISYNHKNPVAEHLRKQIQDYYTKNFNSSIEILKSEGSVGAKPFLEEIRCLIWQADELLIIIPRKHDKLGHDDIGTYNWLIREAEYGLFLNKKIVFLTEEGLNKIEIETLISDKEMDFFLINNSSQESRSSKLLENFRNNTSVQFSPKGDHPDSDWADLNKYMKDTLFNSGEWAIEHRHDSLMKGFLMQFPENTLRVLHSMMELYPEVLLTKEVISKNLVDKYGHNPYLRFKTKSEARNQITYAWNNIKERLLKIEEDKYALLSLSETSRSTYINLLPQILKRLQPNIAEEKIISWAHQLLKI